MTSQSHHSLAASDWIRRFAPLTASGDRVLDLACGGGRHGRLFLRRDCAVTFLDRTLDGVTDLSGQAALLDHDLETPLTDGQVNWPFAPESFDLIIVTNYLHRPLFPSLISSLSPRGILLYETFAVGNERHGRPRNPDHLLRPGELLTACQPLSVLAYECGEQHRPGGSRVIQRIAAGRRPSPWPLPPALQSYGAE